MVKIIFSESNGYTCAFVNPYLEFSHLLTNLLRKSLFLMLSGVGADKLIAGGVLDLNLILTFTFT